MQRVQLNFQILANQGSTPLTAEFTQPETFHVLALLSDMELQQSSLYRQLIARVMTFLNGYQLSCYFELALVLLNSHSSP